MTSCPVSRKQSSWLQLGSDVRRRHSLISLHITAYSAQGATLPAQCWQCFSKILWPFRRWEGRWNDEHGDSRTFFTSRLFDPPSPAALWFHLTSYQLSNLRSNIPLSVMWHQPEPMNLICATSQPTFKASPSNQTQGWSPVINIWLLVLSWILRACVHGVTSIGFRVMIS